MKAALILWLLMTSTCWGQLQAEVQATVRVQSSRFLVRVTRGTLVFPNTALTGRDQTISAVEGPVLEIVDARGDLTTGWRLTMEASQLVTPEGVSLPTEAIRFRASGGSLQLVAGTPVSPTGGPVETEREGALSNGLTVLSTQPGFGMGTYVYQPQPASFQLAIPASAAAGEYRATLVANLLVGP